MITDRTLTIFLAAVSVSIVGIAALTPADLNEQQYLDRVETPAVSAPTTVAGEVEANHPQAPFSATVTSRPERLGNQVQVRETLPVFTTTTVPTGLNGLPFAPDGLDACDELAFYREQAGLPARFDRIGFLESSCRNHVNTWCCYGYFQIYGDLHISSASKQECDVDEIDDMFGREALDKQRNACMALRVYRQQGVCAWDVVRCN